MLVTCTATPKAPSFNTWKKTSLWPLYLHFSDYLCPVFLTGNYLETNHLPNHPSLDAPKVWPRSFKDGPQNQVSHSLFNKHLLKASYVPGACSGSRDRNLSTRPGTQSSWGYNHAYHSRIVQEVLWGKKYQGPWEQGTGSPDTVWEKVPERLPWGNNLIQDIMLCLNRLHFY